jgi:hypothetical protein
MIAVIRPVSAEQYTPTQSLNLFYSLFGPCGNPCYVSGDAPGLPGGTLQDFVAAAWAVREILKYPVIIQHHCRSACAVFADQARPYVYVQEGASFSFHQSFRYTLEVQTSQRELREWLIGQWTRPEFQNITVSVYLKQTNFKDPPHSSDIDRWVKRHGGYPRDDWLHMSYTDALQFWPVWNANR